jgi:hypothetical protein
MTNNGMWSWSSSGLVQCPFMEAVNDLVACEPFKNDLTETVTKGTGFNTMKAFNTLTPLKVIFGNSLFPANQTVYVRADLARDPTAKIQYEVEGRKVVFIPVKEIRLVKRFDPTDWQLTVNASAVPSK